MSPLISLRFLRVGRSSQHLTKPTKKNTPCWVLAEVRTDLEKIVKTDEDCENARFEDFRTVF